ncbi:MAG TPA: hypothetical protein DHV03_07050 [Alphaproteobacteria bacterium]|nr:hypothetical protein [Paracoccaceae bacterium]RCL78196.1 MAG: hypothetical protein DBW67_07545 [SAR116 cluster bacterium]RPH13836.1 MAG: hypothetical protein CBD10_003545 [Alphaproteobacteria bacterium TMED150]HBQ22925.1 hypothetical protein [Alphaproteobacteria bacterium]HCJ61162.1 hypothetical protein [Alphaproteobacteria bacterium]|tara:strand:- start:74 stop:499 length:426 start_codon:yes stop_codon:yes gene_type:complete
MSQPNYEGFAEFVSAEAEAGRLINRSQERELRREGVRSFGLKDSESIWFVRGVASRTGAAVQSDLDERAERILKIQLDEKNRIRKKDFDNTAKIYAALISERMDVKSAKIHLKEVMERNGWKPRRHGLLRRKRWYNKIKIS